MAKCIYDILNQSEKVKMQQECAVRFDDADICSNWFYCVYKIFSVYLFLFILFLRYSL